MGMQCGHRTLRMLWCASDADADSAANRDPDVYRAFGPAANVRAGLIVRLHRPAMSAWVQLRHADANA
jgi:hypothetical protein